MLATAGHRKFVVAFNRDRDSYQVPLALQSASMLQALVTDFYIPDRGLGKFLVPRRLRHRHIAGLPSRLVHSSLRALLLQAYHERYRNAGDGWFMEVDAILSRKAADVAAAKSADLLLYSQYAQEAFADRRLATRLKGLFFYHPHPATATRILQNDVERFPECAWSMENATELVNTDLRSRIDAEIKSADFFLCASSFTRRSLIEQGVPLERISVIPYGTKVLKRSSPRPRDGSVTRFLFVGQGLQRKGLHHLLRAWKAARLSGATLRVICSRLDPGFRSLLDQPTVEYTPAVSREELANAFDAAHVFVMPSLVEGFGLVYLEALAAGCCLIATPNTGVPDLDLAEPMSLLVEPGNIEQLSDVLHRAHRLRIANAIDHNSISRCAETLSWQAFRQRLIASLADISKPPSR